MHNGSLETGNPLVVAVTGHQDAGKTTVVEAMVAAWTSMGLRVGMLKHDGHAQAGEADDWEKAGSDTRRVARAGAVLTMVAGGGATLLRTVSDAAADDVHRLSQRLIEHARSVGQPLDVLLVEGFKSALLPKIVVLQAPDVPWFLRAGLANVQALVAPDGFSHNQLDDLQPPVYYRERLIDLCCHLWATIERR